MTEQAKCQPREADRGQEGLHWLQSIPSGRRYVAQWRPETQNWFAGNYVFSATAKRALTYCYLHPVSPHDPADIARLVEAATKMRRAVDALYMNRHAGRQLREWSVKNVTDLSNDLDTALAAFTAKETS